MIMRTIFWNSWRKNLRTESKEKDLRDYLDLGSM